MNSASTKFNSVEIKTTKPSFIACETNKVEFAW